MDAGTATITLGRREDLAVEGCTVDGVTFVGGVEPADGLEAEVKVRYRSRPVPGSLDRSGTAWRVRFERAQPGVAPGQAAVFYRGDEVLGGGTIVDAA